MYRKKECKIDDGKQYINILCKKWSTSDVKSHPQKYTSDSKNKFNLIMHNPYRLYNDKAQRKHFHYQIISRHPAESTAFMTAVRFNKTLVP